MSYTKQTWANGSSGGTPVSASRMQHIEDGLEEASTEIADKAPIASPAFTGSPKVATGGQLELHNQADQTTNYERLLAKWDTNNCEIKTNFAGTGASRTMRIGVAGVAGLETLSKWLEIKNSSAPFFTTSGSTPTAGTYFQVAGTFTGTSGVQNPAGVNFTVNQSSTAGYTGLQVNATETATGSGVKKLADFQVGGVSKASVSNTGVVSAVPATTAGTAMVRVGVPASATAAGVAGSFAADSSFFYHCVSTNTWVRSALATW